MSNNTRASYLLLAGMMTITLLFSCNSDDDQLGFSSLLPYNPDKHMYGTLQFQDGTRWERWEVAIDLATGRLDSIPGTKEDSGSITSPNGTKDLTAFNTNKRIYIDLDKNLVVQDLDTAEETVIEITDTASGASVLFPQYVRFAASEEELFLIDTDDTVWFIDLLTEEVEKTAIQLPIPSGAYLSNVYYIAATDDFLYSTNSSAINSGTITNLHFYDLGSETVIQSATITESFGLVPSSTPGQFYFLQIPTEDTGFRLVELQVNPGQLMLAEISDADLAIDELTLYTQTTHTATNSYVCRGGSNNLEDLSNTLYIIDLDSGDLIDEVVLEVDGILSKLAGE